MVRALSLFTLIAIPAFAAAAERELTPAERGRRTLETTATIKGFWPKASYENVWKVWGLKEKPADYATKFRERYGLHEAPYANGEYPMGLRKADLLFGPGIGIDCMTCHGGSIFGKSMIGLGNSSLDIEALFEEMAAAAKSPGKVPFAFTRTRGTSEAGAFSVYLLGYRSDDLTLNLNYRDLGLHDDSCEDTPAWWLLKKKKTMYHVGATDSRSVRSLMQFLMHPLTTPADFRKTEPLFRDIQQYLLSLEAPKYPFAVDSKKAATGKALFAANCAKCHGTYGEEWTYPNRIVDIDAIGTDRKRFDNIGPKFGEAYNASWFAKETSGSWFFPGYPIRATAGYQAPPLDGIWATAPYFHNGSVPTLDGVLNSAARPKRFTRSFRTDEADYNQAKVGWKVEEVDAPKANIEPIEKRKVYDTSKHGRGNGGHTYGDKLTADERAAVIEYLKTL